MNYVHGYNVGLTVNNTASYMYTIAFYIVSHTILSCTFDLKI